MNRPNKRIWFWTIIGFCCLICISYWGGYNYFNYKELLRITSDYEALNNEIKYIMELQIKIGGVKSHSFNLKTYKGEKILMNQVFNNENQLVFWIPSNSCPTCYMQRFEQLKILSEKIKKNKIIYIFSQFENNRTILSLINGYKLQNEGVYLTDDCFLQNQELNKLPILFVINGQDLIIQNPLISNKNINREYYDSYLEYIFNCYFQ